MEKTEPVVDLALTRAELSRMLIRRPRRVDGVEDTTFPRSKLMRVLLDPRKRGWWMAGATTVALMFPVAGKVGALASIATRVTKAIARGRN